MAVFYLIYIFWLLESTILAYIMVVWMFYEFNIKWLLNVKILDLYTQ